MHLQIDNDKTTFLPGQRIQGHISINPATVKLLRVKFTGTVSTCISRTESTQAICLFKEIFNLLQDTRLEQEQVYPFMFRIPPTCLPCSFTVHYSFYSLLIILGCMR